MTREAYQRVWQHARDRRGTRKLLLLALAEYADPIGVCWPSIPTIATLISEDDDYTGKLLRQAEEDGDVIRHAGRGRGITTVYGLVIGLPEDQRTRLARIVANTVIKHGQRHLRVAGQLKIYTPGSEAELDQLAGNEEKKGDCSTPFSDPDVENVEEEQEAPPPPPPPPARSFSRPARRPAEEPEHIRWLRVEEGITSAANFAHCDPEALIGDYLARRAEGQPKGAIVRYWKVYPPTKETMYRGRHDAENQPERPVVEPARPAERQRRPKPGDADYTYR
jgi:hypothetical protein